VIDVSRKLLDEVYRFLPIIERILQTVLDEVALKPSAKLDCMFVRFNRGRVLLTSSLGQVFSKAI
jgi:hypothetical protein